jgi:hypothetical protein
MRVLKRDWSGLSRGDLIRIVPLGDVHLGVRACDEKLFTTTVNRIKDDPDCWWIGTGDFADFVNRSDKRFDPMVLAPWLANVGDLAGKQRDRFLDEVKPIASKCLGIICGNHEDSIFQKYERDIYSEIVTAVKDWSGLPADYNLAFGSCGWLLLNSRRSGGGKGAVTRITISLHHGYTGGKLAGGKALDMQRWLWNHDCDLALFGHAHRIQVQSEDVARVDRAGSIVYDTRKGAFCGSFLGLPTDVDGYVEKKGFHHAPVGTILVEIRPGAEAQSDRVRIVM